MRMQFAALLLFCLVSWIPAALSQQDSRPPEDEDSSGDDLELSGSGSGDDGITVLDDKITQDVNTTASFFPYLEATRVSLPTVPNRVSIATEGAVVSLTPLITPGVPEEIPEHPPQEQPTSASSTSANPSSREDATPVPTGARPISRRVTEEMNKARSTSPAAVSTAAVGDDTEVPAVPGEGHLPSTEDAPPALSTSTLSQIVVTRVVSTLDTRDTVATAVPSSGESDDTELRRTNDFIVPKKAPEQESEGDSDIVIDREIRFNVHENAQSSSDNQSLLERKEVLAGVIAGGVVGLAFAITLVSLMVYRMKKKDEGSYALDEHKHPKTAYQKPQRQEEFLA